MVGKKLLVADDSLTIQKVIRLALSNEGYEIQAVSDGNDAVQQIALFRPDVVLIDVSLPGKSAFEVKRSVNESIEFKTTQFVLMSSAFEKVDEAQFKEVQFQGRLTKPFDPAHLRQVLTDVLSRQSSSSLSTASPPGMPPMPPDDPEMKRLTDSTMHINELEDYQWSVSEPTLSSLQNSPSIPGMGSDLPPPLPGDLSSHLPDQLTDGSGTSFQLQAPSDFPPLDTTSASLSSSSSIDELVKSQVEQTLQKMIKTMLPDVAERLIKQEIHRMLSE